MPTKVISRVEDIRVDVEQQRICLEDVLSFLLTTSVYADMVKRFTKIALDGALVTLSTALARMPLQLFKGVGGSRTSRCYLRYISTPAEFTLIVGELGRHYHSVIGKRGKQQGKKIAALWPKVQEFHLQFKRTWPNLWDADHCAACGTTPLEEDTRLQYPAPALMVPTSSASPPIRLSCQEHLVQVYVRLPCQLVKVHP